MALLQKLKMEARIRRWRIAVGSVAGITALSFPAGLATDVLRLQGTLTPYTASNLAQLALSVFMLGGIACWWVVIMYLGMECEYKKLYG